MTNRTKCALALGLATVLGTASAASASQVGHGQNVMDEVARYKLADGAPGYTARIDDGRRVEITVAGLAERSTRRAMTGRDQFEIGSNTKTFMAALTLQLVDRGQVRLDAPVEKYLPGVVPNGKKITVRMLLNHTSGLFSYTADEKFGQQLAADPERVWTEKELLDVAFAHEPNFAPGSGWSYSNTNYTVIGLLLQKQTGKTLADLVQQRIAQPLGLKKTYYAAPYATNTGPGYAHGYSLSYQDGRRVYRDTATWPIGAWGGAAGGIISDQKDLSDFFSGLLGGKLFSHKQLNEMKTTVDMPAEDLPFTGAYGLGLMKVKVGCGTAWGHGGDTLGHHSTAMASENGRRTAVSDTTAEPFDQSTPEADRFYQVAMAAQEITVCEMLGKPVPARVLEALRGTL